MESKLRIKIGEIEFEVEGSENTILRERTEFVQRIMPVAMDALGNIVNLNKETIKKVKKDDNKRAIEVQDNNQSGNNNEFNSEKRDYSRKSLGSFVNEKGQLSEEDFALFAAYFDEQKNQKDYFTSKDVARYYEEARRPKSSNISMSLSRLVQRGLIIDATDIEKKNPKPYRLSLDGINYVKDYQPKEKNDKKSPSKSRNINNTKSEFATLNLDDLELSKYIESDNLKDFKAKMMLIIYIVTMEGKGEWFSINDILCLMTDIFGESATKDQVNGVFRRNKQWFQQKKIEGIVKRKMLNSGKKYVEELNSKQ